MSRPAFHEMLEALWARNNFVCVGLDSDYGKIPQVVRTADIVATISTFNCQIIDATKDLVCAYKPNIAFYEACGDKGWLALRQTISHIKQVAPEVPVILDAKRADIGNTNSGYVQAAFEFFAADAITVHPYLGAEALEPFLARKNKGVLVLCRTSNPGAGEFQDLDVGGEPLYMAVAKRVATQWNKNNNCGLVVGATYPRELRAVREVVGDMPILIPGIGTQGGDVEATVSAGKDKRGHGMIVNASRSIIFSSPDADFADAAQRETTKLRNAINQYR